MVGWINDRARAGRQRDGFTLIELLVVIAILGILAGVVVFSVSGVDDRGESAASATDRRTIRTAEEAYRAQFGRYGTMPELVEAGFLAGPSTLHDVDRIDEEGKPGAGFITRLADDRQVLTVASGGDPWRTSKLRLSRFSLDTGTCETLTKVQNNYAVGPRLAQSWTLIDPGNNPSYAGPTWRFHLRPGVTFHDGTPFTAADVKYSFDRLVAKADDFSARLGADSVSIVDPLTVDVTSTQPNYRLPETVGHPTFGIIKDGTEPSTLPPSPSTVQCTGPFKFKEYVQDSHIAVERNEGYWGPKAKLTKLTFKFVSDGANRRLQLQGGQVDAIFDVGRKQIAALTSNPDLKVVTAPTSAVFMFHQNINGEVIDSGPRPDEYGDYTKLSDERVRRALAVSIDRQAFIDQNYDPGTAVVVPTPSPPSILGPHAAMIEGYRFNLGQARTLLDQAGWTEPSPGAVREKGGEPLRLVVLHTSNDDNDLVEDIRQRARAAGFDLDIKTTYTGTRGQRKNDGRWDLDVATPNQNDANPAFLLTLQWWSRSINPWIRWQAAGPEFDALHDAALASPTYEGAQSFAAQAFDHLIDERAISLPLAGISRVYGFRKGVQGFEPPHPAQSHVSWHRVYLSE